MECGTYGSRRRPKRRPEFGLDRPHRFVDRQAASESRMTAHAEGPDGVADAQDISRRQSRTTSESKRSWRLQCSLSPRPARLPPSFYCHGDSPMNRRNFIQATSGGMATATLPGYFAAAADPKRLRVGLIGTGWYGKCSLFRLIQVLPAVDVVSLCDVDKKMLAEAADLVGQRTKSEKKPRLYADYREMLKEKDLDVVMVETPDHWHALPMIAACEAGADVWLQKPISADVAEGKAMLDAARKHKRVVQVVTQRRSTPHLAEAKREFLDAGKLGKIGLVEICCYYHMRASDNPPVKQPPDHFDYEMWTGPAPLR